MRKKKLGISVIISMIVILLLILKVFFIDYFIIIGNSMNDSFSNKDVILIQKSFYEINRYDILVVKTSGDGLQEQIIKRVIGMPGETVQIIEGKVYINDKLLVDDPVSTEITYAGLAENKITLNDGEYFLLGDNRNNSEDSRYEWVGIIKEKQIIGKCFFKIISH